VPVTAVQMPVHVLLLTTTEAAVVGIHGDLNVHDQTIISDSTLSAARPQTTSIAAPRAASAILQI
jgi:hypothetical protein